MTQKRINEETLQWIKNSTSKIFSRSRFEEAEDFFGGYDGTRRSFGIWQEKFLAEHKRVQQEACIRLMRSCGGSGKKFDIPPTDYLPKGLAEENRCLKCDMVCENETSLKAHMHALEMIVHAVEYGYWLKKTALIGTIENYTATPEEQIPVAKPDGESVYKLVKNNNGVSEMQQTIYKQTNDGNSKKIVVTHQFLDVTTRKHTNEQEMNVDKDRIYKRRKLQAKKMEQLVEHVAGGDEESKAGVVAKYLDQQDPKFVEVVAKKSKALKENKKFTPAQVVTTLCILYAS